MVIHGPVFFIQIRIINLNPAEWEECLLKAVGKQEVITWIRRHRTELLGKTPEIRKLKKVIKTKDVIVKAYYKLINCPKGQDYEIRIESEDPDFFPNVITDDDL